MDYKKTFSQLWRFVIIGIINTAIDYGILLILSAITGITGGAKIIPLNIISFSVATTNSYFLNRRWAFADQSGEQGKKFSLFLIVSIIGVTINTSIVTFITSHVSPMFGLPPRAWLIAAKLVATGVSLIWNFIGYKVIVFKK
ncbi:MAG: GtrA family protein [Candidatus Doudnabacteria bacterium]